MAPAGAARLLTALQQRADAGMKSGIPGQSQDERQRAWEAAREAAGRSGVPISEWLDSVISMKEAADPLRPPPRAPEGSPPHQEDLSGVKSRLDTLSRQLDELARANATKG